MIRYRHIGLYLAILLFVCAGIAACQQHDGDKEGVAVPITGLDYLADYLSVQDFTVNGVDGAQAGKGGSTVCCVMLPRKWQSGMTVKITWNVTNWRDCTGHNYGKIVPIDKYEDPGYLYVSFLPNGRVRVTSSAKYGPISSHYPGPHLNIPDKHPWNIYDLKTCKKYDQEQHKE